MNIYDSMSYDWGEEKVLAEKASSGDKEALDNLTRLNRKYVISVARRYQDKGYTLNEFIGIGEQGMLKAAQRFIECGGRNFNAYAYWWVRDSILNELDGQSRILRKLMIIMRLLQGSPFGASSLCS